MERGLTVPRVAMLLTARAARRRRELQELAVTMSYVQHDPEKLGRLFRQERAEGPDGPEGYLPPGEGPDGPEAARTGLTPARYEAGEEDEHTWPAPPPLETAS